MSQIHPSTSKGEGACVQKNRALQACNVELTAGAGSSMTYAQAVIRSKVTERERTPQHKKPLRRFPPQKRLAVSHSDRHDSQEEADFEWMNSPSGTVTEGEDPEEKKSIKPRRTKKRTAPRKFEPRTVTTRRRRRAAAARQSEMERLMRGIDNDSSLGKRRRETPRRHAKDRAPLHPPPIIEISSSSSDTQEDISDEDTKLLGLTSADLTCEGCKLQFKGCDALNAHRRKCENLDSGSESVQMGRLGKGKSRKLKQEEDQKREEKADPDYYPLTKSKYSKLR